ncbi:MAG: hypothetical protein IID08_04750 [Candidatus Hydrogenedentes bacterium]|nr:hypothetical protein [Candidatus Hydrogenedentota bacterium]
MSSTAAEKEHLNDFERAICYYTLPRVNRPVTFGLIVAYVVCLGEAVAVFVYGVATQNETWLGVGRLALIGIIGFGLIAFITRAFLNEVRTRRALAAAKGVHDATAPDDGTPDPFAGHILLRYRRHRPGDAIEITDNSGRCQYRVQTEHHGKTWIVEDTEGRESAHIDARWGGRSFGFDGGVPAVVGVSVDGKEIARLNRRRTWTTSVVDIVCEGPEREHFVVRDLGVYRDERMVGRVYRLRGYTYLDIERTSFCDAILGFFIAMV